MSIIVCLHHRLLVFQIRPINMQIMMSNHKACTDSKLSFKTQYRVFRRSTATDEVSNASSLQKIGIETRIVRVASHQL